MQKLVDSSPASPVWVEGEDKKEGPLEYVTQEEGSRISIIDEINLILDYGVRLKKEGKYLTAMVVLKRAAELAPGLSQVWANLGGIQWNYGDFEGALNSLERALSLDPTHPEAHANLGLVLTYLGRQEESEKAFKNALLYNEKDPTREVKRRASILWNRSITRLGLGNWEGGLEDYEARMEYRGSDLYPKLPCKIWQGEDLNYKTITVLDEQGIGDRFLSSRYLHWIHKTYPHANIQYATNQQFFSIMWGYKDLASFVPMEVPWPDTDYGIRSMSIPRLHKTRPWNVYPDPGIILKRSLPHIDEVIGMPQPWRNSLRVGIAWTGNPDNQTNVERSIPFEFMLELAENPEVVIYSLQCGDSSTEIQRLGAQNIITDLSPNIMKKGWVGTSMVMLNLDLIITVCTSIAHLAGCLRIPCWVLLCKDPYWIWLRDREDSLWYPSIRLIRQKRQGDWPDVIDRTKILLKEYTSQIKDQRN